jgi:hypothetical protein
VTKRCTEIPLTLLLAVLLLIASCGDNDHGATGPDNGELTGPPEIANFDLPGGIDFQSDDPIAQQAQLSVGIALIPLAYTIGNPLVASLQNAVWGEPSGGCWSWDFTPEEGCSFLYTACKTDSGFDWTVTVNGECSGTSYESWIAIRGTSDDKGTTGILRWFENNSTELAKSWAWTTDEEWFSGTLNIYDGELAPENLSNILEWTRDPDGSVEASFTRVGAGMLELLLSSDGTVGWLKTYDLNGGTGAYVIEKWISWENGTGFWNVYEEGDLVEERTW